MTEREDVLLAVAMEAVRAGGAHALENRDRRGEVLAAFRHDVKLVLDVECQGVIERLIRRRFPDHAFLGEEGDGHAGDAPASDGLQWIVDPIDGTVNFSNGLPIWCCSVAVRRGEQVLAGAVYAPMLDSLYAATAHGPATCNDRIIRVSDRPTLEESIVLTGLDRFSRPGVPPLRMLTRLAEQCRKARIAGSAAVDLCWVAQGAAEGYFEDHIYLWDVAAAGLIVERAGGRTEILARRTDEPHALRFMASNGHIHDRLRALLTAD